ncbi:hypothetical protein LTR62_003203 [Meristemomyces frigidus]|uniref:Uncharacterized protein n=1 Tax=Meristemomyces frigidus TaxID=1508187 RepID=A0AAN7TF99_9PEZI|nr:hypothetical protein LTR62_003203 [Meristemomyces frigidus]
MLTNRCILLVGAPVSGDLVWDDANLSKEFERRVQRYVDGIVLSTTGLLPDQSSTTSSPPKWRGVSMRDPKQDATMLQTNVAPATHFLSFEQKSEDAMSRERLRFLEHSIAVLDDLQSSQIDGLGETTALISTFSFATSVANTSFSTSNEDTDYSSTSPAKLENSRQVMVGDVTDLRRIPPADHITRIHPQTMTVNLLAAIISVSSPRTINLRKRNAEMDIIELVLGDETRAGFSISFWLTPVNSPYKQRDDLRDSLAGLRSGDVVSVQNVALSAFNKSVYGQSLSRRFARNNSCVIVLGDDGLSVLPASLRAKGERVHRWADEFVGRSRTVWPKLERKVKEGGLPPDTQSPGKYG